MKAEPTAALHERFPALYGLASWWKRRVPTIRQTSAADCGAACIAMVLAHHGEQVPLDDVRSALGNAGRGSSAPDLLDVAQRYGLRGRGVALRQIDELRLLAPGSILHWRFNHFVVFERLRRGHVEIIDPAQGRRRVRRDEVDRAFTGVALTFEPSGEAGVGEFGVTPTGPSEPRFRWAAQRGSLARRAEVRLLASILGASLLLQAFSFLVPLTTGVLIERVVPQEERVLLAQLFFGLLTITVVRLLVALARSALLVELRARFDARLTLEFVAHLVHLPVGFFAARSIGDLSLRIESNVVLRELLSATAVSGLLDGFVACSALLVLLIAKPALGLLAAGLGALRAVVLVASRGRRRDLLAASLAAQSASRSSQFEIISGIETIKAAGAEERTIELWTRRLVAELNAATDRARLEGVTSAILDALTQASPLLLILAGTAMVIRGDLSLGAMLGLTSLATIFLGPVSNLTAAALQLELFTTLRPRLEEVLRAVPERWGGRRPGALRGAIAVREVEFGYGSSTTPILRDISLSIEPGQSVALVGRSGSGKTTLARLLAGLYLPTAGSITVDGIDLRDVDLQWLRRRLGFVPQTPVVFRQSIRDNIALNEPGLPFSRVVEAARLAAIHDEIMCLPMGYETVLFDGGASLSGGQRQRLILARALACRPAVLVLDESTSSLDALTELEVTRALDSLDATRIVIAHRLSTIRSADLIVVLNQGRIIEAGTHDQLSTGDGEYRRLIHAQI